jgi:uncharacterized protein (TIGR00255 family)
VSVNVDQIIGVLEQLSRITPPEGITSSAALGDVLTVPGLISVRAEETVLDEGESSALRALVSEAVDAMVGMRAAEGARLEQQILDELHSVVGFLDWFEPRLDDLRVAAMTRARQRIEDLIADATDADRVVQEAAILADRADVAEEVVRLRAHIEAFSDRLDGGGTIGRTLDFLCQEIHRELNTLGSKCREAGIAERLVDAKSAAERVREQVQNIE